MVSKPSKESTLKFIRTKFSRCLVKTVLVKAQLFRCLQVLSSKQRAKQKSLT